MSLSRLHNTILKKITGEATPEELAYLEESFRDDPTLRDEYMDFQKLWDKSSDYEALNFKPDPQKAYQNHLSILANENNITALASEKKTKVSRLKISTLSSIAAMFVIGMAALFLLKNEKTAIRAENGVQFVSLLDGSKVWLNEGSEVSYGKGFGTTNRNITLDGKAFFDVERDEDLPFNVSSSSDLNLSVLGTSFTINSSSDDLVDVTSGLVKVELNGETAELAKNQSLRVSGGKFEVIEKDNSVVDWRNPELSFSNTPIEQVISDINMYYKNKFVASFSNEVKNDCTFTSGSLKGASMDTIIELFTTNYDLETEKTSQGIYKLYFNSCK